DTVWLKAYVVAGQHNYLATLSRIVHIDLIGEGRKVLQSLSLPLSFGIGVGDLVLPATADSYRIRVYTNWMRNFDKAYFFEKDLTRDDPSTPPSEIESSDIHIYSEGGSWSYDRPNRI